MNTKEAVRAAGVVRCCHEYGGSAAMNMEEAVRALVVVVRCCHEYGGGSAFCE
jgi:hypothetical protein